MNDESSYERLKWTVLEEAGYHHNAGIAYYWAKRAFPDREEQIDRFVQRALLELLDEGLIFFHWGGWDDGCDLDPHTAERATRAEVEADSIVVVMQNQSHGPSGSRRPLRERQN